MSWCALTIRLTLSYEQENRFIPFKWLNLMILLYTTHTCIYLIGIATIQCNSSMVTCSQVQIIQPRLLGIQHAIIIIDILPTFQQT